MKIEPIRMIGQAVDIETQMVGMSMIGNMTGVIKAAASMLMSDTDTDVIQSKFCVRCTTYYDVGIAMWMLHASQCFLHTVDWISDTCSRIHCFAELDKMPGT